MKIKGIAADYSVLTDPRLYRKYVTTENRATVLYVELRKALYGQLKAALLFYKKSVKDLKGIGFERKTGGGRLGNPAGDPLVSL